MDRITSMQIFVKVAEVGSFAAAAGELKLSPAMVARFVEMGVIAAPGTPDEFGAFVRREIAQWREVARMANVRLEG